MPLSNKVLTQLRREQLLSKPGVRELYTNLVKARKDEVESLRRHVEAVNKLEISLAEKVGSYLNFNILCDDLYGIENVYTQSNNSNISINPIETNRNISIIGDGMT